MKLLNRFNISKEKGGSRKFSFEMTMSGVISVGIVVVLGMCWVFILGILVGRGYRPETAVPQIAQMMPTTEAKQPDNAATAAPTVLKPEELQFMDGLQENKDGEVVTDSTQKLPADNKKAPQPVVKDQEVSNSRTVPTGTARAATAIPAPAVAPVAKTVPARKSTPKEEHAAKTAEDRRLKTKPEPKVEAKAPVDKKTSAKFAATYQVASFPSKQQAETMVKELSHKGFSASIQEGTSRNKTVFRVKVQLKGTEVEITDGLRRTGEKGPILLGKKPL